MQDFYYRMVDDGTYYITGYEGDESEVVIPTDRVFTILSDKIFRGHSEITSIQIPDTVTDIGEFVFDGCVNLRHLKLPANLRPSWQFSCPCRHRRLLPSQSPENRFFLPKYRLHQAF